MENPVRGIECVIDTDKIKHLLLLLSQENCAFYIPWCYKIDNDRIFLPQSSREFSVTAQGLTNLTQGCIFELVLHLYPHESKVGEIETYQDFLDSECLCCLIFYDCGYLDIYIKEQPLFQKIWDALALLKAKDMNILTAENDGRTVLHT